MKEIALKLNGRDVKRLEGGINIADYSQITCQLDDNISAPTRVRNFVTVLQYTARNKNILQKNPQLPPLLTNL